VSPWAAACRESSEEHRPAGPRLIVATLRSGARGKELSSDSSGRTSGPFPLLIHRRGLWKALLGSSLSSGAANWRLQVRHEALVDGVGDAPLEAPQRLLAGFALI
jgi:hypothetical protein